MPGSDTLHRRAYCPSYRQVLRIEYRVWSRQFSMGAPQPLQGAPRCGIFEMAARVWVSPKGMILKIVSRSSP